MHYTVAFEKYDYEGRVGEKKKNLWHDVLEFSSSSQASRKQKVLNTSKNVQGFPVFRWCTAQALLARTF